jgi:large subunit ribosomal protein L10
MATTKAKKNEILAEVRDMVNKGTSVFFADFRGLTVADVQTVRKELRAHNVGYKVAKKTLIRKAAAEKGYQEIPREVMEGSVAMTVSYGDPLAPARLLKKLAKTYEKLALLGGLFEGQILSSKEAAQYAALPSKEELLAKLVYMMKSPLQGLHGSLNGLLSKFVRTLDAVAKKA